MIKAGAWRVEGTPRAVWALLVVAVCLRLAALAVFPSPYPVSASESGLTAANWVAGQGYTFDFYGYRTANPLQSFMPPLFTAVVAACLVTPWPEVAFSIVQVILSSLTVLLVYWIAARLAGLTVGLVAATLTAVHPPFLILVHQNTTGVFNTFLLALWLWATICLIDRGGRRWAVLAGLALGLNVLSRPSTAGLLGVMLLGLWLGREARSRNWWRPAMVAVATMGLTIMPWLARNLWIHGQFALSSYGGFTFWVGNNTFTTGSSFDVVVADLAAYSGETIAVPDGITITPVNPYPLPLELRGTVATLEEVALDRALYRASLAFIRAHPRRWLGLLAQKLVSLWWFRPNVGRSSGFYQESWILPYEILYTGALAAAVAGLVLSFRHWRRYVLVYGLFAYLTGVYVAYNAITRYRWEMEPYLLLLAALALVTGWSAVPWRAGRPVSKLD
jgi:hypothetical protein